MLNSLPESYSQLFPTPNLQDRSLKTVDIKGAQPQKPFVRQQEIFENRSLFTNDIKGAQPKAHIRALAHPHYDPAVRVDSSSFFGHRSPEATSQMKSPNQPQVYLAPPNPPSRPTYSSSQPNISMPAQLSSPSYEKGGAQQYQGHASYQPINAHDPQKNSFYNGPIADRTYKPNNQPPSQIKVDQLLATAPYQQGIVGRQSSQPQQYFAPSPLIQQQQRPLSNNHHPAHRSLMSSSEIFSHSAVLRPNHFDSLDNYNLFRQSIRERVVRQKHDDLPDKMTKYQMNKDNIFKFQQPKLQMNREKLNSSLLVGNTSSDVMNPHSRGLSTSSPSMPQFVQQQYQMKGSQMPQLANVARIASGQQPSSNQQMQQKQQFDQGRRPASDRVRSENDIQLQGRANSNRLAREMSPVGLLSPKYANIERNISSKAGIGMNAPTVDSIPTESDKIMYFKPYHLNPNIDVSTEYTDKYNLSQIDQLKASLTAPMQSSHQRKEAGSAVPWQKKQFAYNLIGNYVRDKRKDDSHIVQGTAIDKYYKGYDGEAITNMRKDIKENGVVIPYEVKYKFGKNASDAMHYPIDGTSTSNLKLTSSPQQQQQPKVAAVASGLRHNEAGHSDLFRTQNYNIRDPVNPNKFVYAQKGPGRY